MTYGVIIFRTFSRIKKNTKSRKDQQGKNEYTFVNTSVENLLPQQRDVQELADETLLSQYKREQQPECNLSLVSYVQNLLKSRTLKLNRM